MKKGRKKPEGGSNWMDTYGDMVTLLLCFFVLLYSISTVDEQKWEAIVKSLNPNAEMVQEDLLVAGGEYNADGTVPTEGAPDKFDDLYHQLKSAIEVQGLSANVEINKGDGFTFISFRNHVFFDGESSVLKPEGQQILDAFSEVIATASEQIKEIQILGHTSQAEPGIPNNVRVDRILSANRAAEVTIYLQDKNIIEPSKLVCLSYGQHRPIATFATFEGRARNRRVELLITKSDSVEKSLDEYYQQIYSKEQQ